MGCKHMVNTATHLMLQAPSQILTNVDSNSQPLYSKYSSNLNAQMTKGVMTVHTQFIANIQFPPHSEHTYLLVAIGPACSA